MGHFYTRPTRPTPIRRFLREMFGGPAHRACPAAFLAAAAGPHPFSCRVMSGTVLQSGAGPAVAAAGAPDNLPGGVMHRYLVVANQTLGSQELRDLISERVAHGPAEFWLVVPATPVSDLASIAALPPMPVVGGVPTISAATRGSSPAGAGQAPGDPEGAGRRRRHRWWRGV
ncbi:hypothetical protein [Pseudonocardia hierapolitana]|uniref:hypothetical protein n=1 Tax=Pseudonocardia hierapolitana TaxID=1128676 RepID=UPI0011BDB8BC|nr:hypothetical protein [Pseudonocardia hierapolitana]